jgi:hypothetical protein
MEVMRLASHRLGFCKYITPVASTPAVKRLGVESV